MDNDNTTITIAYMNVRGQTGLDLVKQLQIEHFLKSYRIDILNCQEINISEDSFTSCDYVTSAYNILTNNAQNKYGTCSFVSNSYQTSNVKTDTNGRVLAFDVDNLTLCNVYLHSGTDQLCSRSNSSNIDQL